MNMENIPIAVGDMVKGEIIYLSKPDISVEITRPYTGVSSGRHILLMAMGYIDKDSYDSHAFAYKDENGLLKITKHGLKRAEEILLEIYEACKKVELNQHSLRQACIACRLKILREFAEKAAADNDVFYEDRAELLRAKKSSGMKQNEYGRRLKMLKDMEMKIKSEQYRMVSKKIRIGISLVEQLIEKYSLNKSFDEDEPLISDN